MRDEAQQIIKTVPRRGYIFDRPVSENGPTALTTYTEETSGVRIIIEEEETNGHEGIETQSLSASGQVGLIPAHHATSLEHLLTAIEQHKLRAILGVLTVMIAAAAIVYFTRPGEAIDSIAVLPFVNVTGDPNTEYLSDGLSGSVIDNLSRLPNLKVIALNSVLRYKGKELDPQEVGRKLSVRAVLISRLVQHGDDLSISAELIDVRDDRHLWGGEYKRKLADITTLQTEIAQEISGKLRLPLTGEQRQRLTKHYTENIEAYQSYLKGRYFSDKRTEEGLEKGLEYFQHAIEKDSNYVLAYVGLADSYNLLAVYGALPPKDSLPKAKAMVTKALEIDDKLGEAHASLAFTKMASDWDWTGAEIEFKRAIELSPNYATAHHWYAEYFAITKQHSEALSEIKRAQELDPLSLLLKTEVGRHLYYARQYDQAIERLREVIEMDANFARAHQYLGRAYEGKMMFQEALAASQRAWQLDNTPRTLAFLGYAYARAGKRGAAQKAIDELKEQSKRKYVSPYWIAIVYTGLDEREAALEWLNKLYEERSAFLIFLKVEPIFDSLRNDPRFQDLLKRTRLNL